MTALPATTYRSRAPHAPAAPASRIRCAICQDTGVVPCPFGAPEPAPCVCTREERPMIRETPIPHTKGPWRKGELEATIILGPHHEAICSCFFLAGREQPQGETAANATILAASPTIYDALRNLVAAYQANDSRGIAEECENCARVLGEIEKGAP